MELTDVMAVEQLLKAALNNSLSALAADTGQSAPRLAQQMLHAIQDPDVIAAYPTECRQLAARRDAARQSRRTPATTTPQNGPS